MQQCMRSTCQRVNMRREGAANEVIYDGGQRVPVYFSNVVSEAAEAGV